jgi:serine/threonine-protein kinase
VPPNVAATVMKSIEKLPADRFDSAKEFMDALGDETFTHAAVRTTPRTTAARATARPAEPTSWLADGRSRVAVGAIGVLAVLGGLALLTRGPAEGPPQPTVRAPIPLDPQYTWSRRGPRISADGRRIMLLTLDGIMIRDVDQPTFRLLPGTEDADEWASLSPDGEWVVFGRDRDNDLFKISVTASSPITLVREERVDAIEPHWGEDGTIVFRSAGTQDIWRVSESGGDAELVGEDLGQRASILPDGSGILYTRPSLGVGLLDLATGDTTLLSEEALDAVYAPTGHILFGHPAGGLFALPFDLDTHEATGSPIPVLDEVGVSGNVAHFDVSTNGTLVFTRGGGGALTEEIMLVMHPDMGVDTVRITPRSLDQVRFAPDGSKVVFHDAGGVRSDDRQIWIYDLVLESLRQLSFDGGHRAVWSPAGDYVAYSSEGPGTNGEDLWVHASDGASDPRHLALDIPGDEHSASWPMDTVLVFATDGDLYVVNPLADSPEARPYVEAEYGEYDFDLDPTGRFAAYTTDEYNRDEVFVRDFPTPRGKWRVSSDGGADPKWSADGRSLYYLSLDGRSIVRHDLEVDAGVTPLGSEVVWRIDGTNRWDFDPASGRAVVMAPVGEEGAALDTDLWIVVNWFEELKRLTGGGRR